MENWQNIIDYLSGESTPEERKQIDKWRSEAEENEQYFKKVQRIWETSSKGYQHYEPNTEKAWAKMQAVLNEDASSRGNRIAFTPWVLRVAAALVVLIIASFILINLLATTQTATTSTGERTQITLADGTTVWLNSNSSFQYPTSFENDSLRLVKLEGEAFFEVAKNPNKPFIIETERTKTQVLGTSFELSDRATSSAEITVVTGKVRFGNAAQQVSLLPNETATLADNTLTKNTQNDKNFLAWKTNQLIFDHIPLREVFIVMEEYFHIQIEVKDKSLLNCPFTGNYKKPSLEELIEVFELGANIQFQKKNNVYIVSGEGC